MGEFRTFTVPQVAEKLQISERTVRSMIAEGTFAKHCRIGNQIRFVAEDFFSWLESRGENEINKRKIGRN